MLRLEIMVGILDELWLEFWTAFSGPGWSLYVPTHRHWEWFYDARDNLIIHMESDTDINAYSVPREGHRLHSWQVYPRSHTLGQVLPHCLPVNVLILPGDQILCREIGPPLAIDCSECNSFWSHLCSIGGEWMWE